MRVSTDRQAVEGFSLDAQRERLEAYCTSQGWKVAAEYVDDGESAKSLDRPAFQQMLRECEKGDYILVYRLDRLTRSSKDLEFLIELAEKRNIYFKSATEDVNTSTSSGRFHLRLVVQFAQYERETIAERSSMGKVGRVKSGLWQGGKPPFGYITVDSDEVKNGRVLKRLEPDPMRAHLVPQIFERYLSGYGTRAISQWFNLELQAKTPSGAAFSSTYIARILKNQLYCGYGTYSRTKAMAKGVDFETIRVNVPALISEETFLAAQELLKKRKDAAPRHATGQFPLTGIAVCGNCGSKLFGGNASNGQTRHLGKRWRTYWCANYRKGRQCGRDGQKSFATVSANVVEANLLRILDELVHSNAAFDAFFDGCLADSKETFDAVLGEIERVRQELDDSRSAIARWDTKYERAHIDEDEHEEKTRPHKDRIKSLQERLDEMEKRAPQKIDKEEVKAAFESVTLAWVGLTPQERKAMLQHLVEIANVTIVVYPDRRVELRPRGLDESPTPAGE